jgi:hypothetical protein
VILSTTNPSGVKCWRSAAAVEKNYTEKKPQRGDMLVAKNDYSEKQAPAGRYVGSKE